MSCLPLPTDMCRCLGHEPSADRVAPGITGAGCQKSETCARHVSIRWDAFDARIVAAYRLCEPATFEHYIPAYAEGQP